MPIEILRNPPLEVAQALSDGIVGFNRTTIPNLERNEDEVRFHVIAKDNLGELVGGLRGACYWNTLHI